MSSPIPPAATSLEKAATSSSSSSSPALLILNAYPFAMVFLAFFFLRPLPDTVRSRRLLATFLLFLPYFFLSQHLVPFTMHAMMSISLFWMFGIKLFHLMSRPDKERLKPAPAGDWFPFLPPFLREFLWFTCPVLRNNSSTTAPSTAQVILVSLKHAFMAFLKMHAIRWMNEWMLLCLTPWGEQAGETYVRPSFALTVQFATMMMMGVMMGTSMYDNFAAVVNLVTWGRYTVLQFNNWVLLSDSPREFWGRRYNRLVGTLLRDCVFMPLKNEVKLSPGLASLLTFSLSGMLHIHVSHIVFRQGEFTTFVFFLLHGLACSVDWAQLIPSRAARIILTNVFVMLTAPLYMGLFVYASPAWLKNNMPPLAPFFHIAPPNICPVSL